MVALVVLVLQNEPPKGAQAQHINKEEAKVAAVSTPVVTPAPTPTVAPPQVNTVTHAVGCANYAHIIAKYNWNNSIAMAICQAESGGDPYAIGDTRVIGGIYAPSCGLFQVRTLAGRPNCEQLHNPETNIAWAYKIYIGQGYSAWSVCKTKVRCY